ncbi:unnamed protein product, partial [Medioppia subpectinata]
ENGMCSPRGVAAVFDENADGYVKGEAVCCAFLQRRRNARRVYATVLAARMNIDGNKTTGMYFPSADAQQQLMIDTYNEANVDPLEVTYFETHCTGTKAGDPQEIKAIYNAYVKAPGRTEPLPLGALKSNVGHSEAGSGMSSLIKMCIVYENECIPPNLNMKQLKDECLPYCPPLKPIVECTPYKPGLAALDNFGIGGANAHVLLEPNPKVGTSDGLRIAETIPRIVNICGRTEDAVKYVMDFIQNNPKRVTNGFLALLANAMKYTPSINSSGMPFRGVVIVFSSLIIRKVSENSDKIEYEYRRQISIQKCKTVRPLWVLFPGLGGQWPAMAKALMPIKIFADKVEECHQILKEFGIDLKTILLSEDKTAISTMTAKFVSTTAIEIALFDVMKALDITPDGIIGHSFGEIACAYADGCMTTRETMIASALRGIVTTNDKNIPKGLMAVVGLPKAEMQKLCPNGVYIACNNAKESVVISGPDKEMREIIESLSEKNVFVRQLESSNIAYHSKYIQTSAQPLADAIDKYIPHPKPRSKKWLSTSLLSANPKDERLLYASGAYNAYNLANPVQFYDRLQQLPADAIVLEIGPHSLFGKIVTETLNQCSYVSLIKKDSNDKNMDLFLSGLSTLYELGVNMSVDKLYPKVEWPVPRGTQAINSLIKWDHSLKLPISKYPERYNQSTASDMNVTINCGLMEDAFYLDHCVDGNPIFPGFGYLILAWRKLAASMGNVWYNVPVIFESVQYRRAVFLTEGNEVTLTVKYYPLSGEFSVHEKDNVCVAGKIRASVGDDTLIAQHLLYDSERRLAAAEHTINRDDIYKEFRIMGLDYKQSFQRLLTAGTNDYNEFDGVCEWDGNLITYMDSISQSRFLSLPARKLLIPVFIRKLRLDPRVMLEAFRSRRRDETAPTTAVTQQLADNDANPFILTTSDQIPAADELQSYESILNQEKQRFDDRFAQYSAEMPFYYNMATKQLVAPGFELDEVFTYFAPRRQDITALVLDSQEFCPNDDNQAIDGYLSAAVTKYLQVCNSLASKLQQMGVKEIKCDFNCEKVGEEVIQEFRTENNENHVMFRTFDRILEKALEENTNKINSKEVSKILNEIQTNSEYDLSKDVVNQIQKNERMIRSLMEIVCENYVTVKEINITEINLSDSFVAKEIDQIFTHFRILPFEIDYKLIVKNKQSVNELYRERASEWQPNDEIPLKPSHLVIMRDSQDLWPIDLSQFTQDLFDSINTNGFLVSIFRYKFTEPEIAFMSLKGNTIPSNNELEARIKTFESIATKTGFKLIATKSDTIGTICLMFRKIIHKPIIPEKHNVIDISGDYEQWFGVLQDKIIDAMRADNKTDNVWLMSKESSINGIIGLVNCLRLEPGGENFRYIFHMDTNNDTNIDFNTKPYSDILANDLVANVIKGGKLGTYRHFKLPADFDKCVSNDYYLNSGPTKDLAGLQWYDSRKIPEIKTSWSIANMEISKTRVEVYCSGISFHDVMVASGRIPAGPEQLFTDCVLGCEYAGRRVDTGKRVMGIDYRAFATSLNATINSMTTVPEHWSMADAVTILSTYSTLYYALIKRANLKKGESVLIHSAAGGVGQAAINMCKHYDCDIYTTVGTEEKKQFLINEYNIPEERIFGSRDKQFLINEYNIPEERIFGSRDVLFKAKLLKITNGKGVDVVLNSLSGEKLDASYECVANSGRFIELGRFDMIQNKQIGMFDFVRDIQFIGVVVDIPITTDIKFFYDFYDWVHKNSKNGCVKPLNYTLFEAKDADKAFRYMTTGKHMGKVVIKMRAEEIDRRPLMAIKPAVDMVTTIKTFFDPNKVYIITGGLGGFGLELIPWMQFFGARKFVTTSRSGLRTEYQKYIYNRFKKFYKNMKIFESQWIVSTADGFTIEGTNQVLREAQELGPIGGVFHLTIDLNDCLLGKLTFEKFCSSIDTKHKIFANLDQLTRQLNYPLDYFVVFSSLTCGKGNGGQTNYAFGNSMCERICEERRRDGLHGLAVQYGPVGDVGVFADTSENLLSITCVRMQRINSCCDVLDKLLSIKQTVVTSYGLSRTTYKCTIKVDMSTKASTGVKSHVIAELWRALGIDPSVTPNDLTLGEIGLESMFAVELQQELEREFNVNISLNQIKSITIGMLKDFESGNTGHVECHLDEMKQMRANYLKRKFIIPTETHTRLNAVTTGRPVYFMPTLSLNFTMFEQLAQSLNRPVIGLNWTRDMNKLTTLKQVNEYFVTLMKRLEPRGGYDVVGYLDGAFAASKLLLKGWADKVVIIDVMSYDRLNVELDQLTDEDLLIFIFRVQFSKISPTIRDRIVKDMKKLSDNTARVKHMTGELLELVGKGLVAPDIDEIYHILLARLRMLLTYRSEKTKKWSNRLKMTIAKKWSKSVGKLIMIKPVIMDGVTDVNEGIGKSRDAYLLPGEQE